MNTYQKLLGSLKTTGKVLGFVIPFALAGCDEVQGERDNLSKYYVETWEYLDVNQSGEYESYRIIREYNGRRRIMEDLEGAEIFPIRFASPLSGSTLEGEFSREILINMFDIYNCPAADSIEFQR
jgi:hypothetical protein